MQQAATIVLCDAFHDYPVMRFVLEAGLYQHMGYQVLEHAPIAGTLETWALFRPR